MSNASTRVPATLDPTEIFEVDEPGDLGVAVMAPDGVMRVPIVLGASYRFRKSVVLPRMWWPASPEPSIATILTGDVGIILACDGDDTPHIWGRDTGIIIVEKLQFIDSSNGGSGLGTRMFDLVGVGNFSFLIPTVVTFVQFKSLGALVDVSFILGNALIVAMGSGFVVRSTPGFEANSTITVTRVENSPIAPVMTSAAFTFIGGPPSVIMTTATLRQALPANAFVHIDSASTGAYNIGLNHYQGGPAFGSFFRPNEVLSVTDQADVSIAITSFVDSTVDPGVDTTCVLGAITDVKRGDAVLITGEAAYDGPHLVVRVAADLMSFDIAVVHSTSGAGTMAIVEHTVPAGVRVVEGETVEVAGTTDYNGTSSVFRRTSDTTFTLPQVFVSGLQAGTATSTGRDQTSSGVLVKSNGEQEDSAVIGEFCMNGNALPDDTPITDVTYTPIVFAGGMLAPGAERVELVDAATGRLRYIGEAPARVAVTISLFCENAPASATQYRISFAVDGVMPVFASAPYAPLELRAVNQQVAYLPTLIMSPGDEIQPVIAGDGFTSDVLVTDAQFIIRD